MSSENKVAETINAIKGLAEAVPIYPDLVQPAAKELGKTLETAAKCVNIALAPLSGLVWGYEQFKGFVEQKVATKLVGVSPERIQTPALEIAGPIIEALRFRSQNEPLADMFASLLATAMDAKTASTAHPGFIQTLINLSAIEAQILSLLRRHGGGVACIAIAGSIGQTRVAGGQEFCLAHEEELGALAETGYDAFIENLERLGLIEVINNPTDFWLEHSFQKLESLPKLVSTREHWAKGKA